MIANLICVLGGIFILAEVLGHLAICMFIFPDPKNPTHIKIRLLAFKILLFSCPAVLFFVISAIALLGVFGVIDPDRI